VGHVAHGEGLPYRLGRLLRDGPLTRRQIRARTGWSREQADYAIARGVRMGVVRKRMAELTLEQAGSDFHRHYGYLFEPGARLEDGCRCPSCSGYWR
jgi:hypothetical protein